MTRHEAEHVLARLYMNDVINTSQLMQLTARLENDKQRDRAIKSIQQKSKRLLK